MTVADVMSRLSDFPGDATVYHLNDGGEYGEYEARVQSMACGTRIQWPSRSGPTWRRSKRYQGPPHIFQVVVIA